MNVIKLYGGLGNQMFQYAFGKAQEHLGIDVQFDINPRGDASRRPFILDKFKTNIKHGNLSGRKVVKERKSGFRNDLLLRDRCSFIGYWQHPDYSKDILPQLQREFCVKDEFYTKEFLKLKNEITNCNSISLHVRRGDYVTIGMFVTELDYYLRAIKFITTIKDNPIIYVFSDDMDWCKENFVDVKYIHLQDYLDFELMKLCKSNIITNSTFSWWAARLNPNPDKVVIAPEQWQHHREDTEKKDREFLILKDWIAL
jgi:hypothetical protein